MCSTYFQGSTYQEIFTCPTYKIWHFSIEITSMAYIYIYTVHMVIYTMLEKSCISFVKCTIFHTFYNHNVLDSTTEVTKYIKQPGTPFTNMDYFQGPTYQEIFTCPTYKIWHFSIEIISMVYIYKYYSTVHMVIYTMLEKSCISFVTCTIFHTFYNHNILDSTTEVTKYIKQPGTPFTNMDTFRAPHIRKFSLARLTKFGIFQ